MQPFFIGLGMASLAPVFATGTSAQDFIGWMIVGIVIIFIAGLLLYYFFVVGARERDRQMVQARVRAARGAYPAQRGAATERYPLTRRYEEAPDDMPEAVRAAYDDIRSGRGGQYRQYAESDGAYAGETFAAQDSYETLPEARPARRAPGVAGRTSPPGRSVRKPDVLEELLGSRRQAPGPVRLEAEDRQLLWEEAHEPEAPAAAPEEEEVLFIDDETEGAIPEEGSAEPGGPPAKDEFVTGPLALLLLQKDIENAVKEGPRGPGPRGPAWSEGRPVFSKPLEAPTEAAPASAARPPPLDMDEFTVQLKSLAEKKKLESRRLAEDRTRREQQNAREDAARRQAQQKREEKLRREIRGRVRAGISEAQKQQAAEGPPGMSAAEEEAQKAQEEKKLEEERRKEERRKRWLELQKKHEVETIEDVLSKIGIK